MTLSLFNIFRYARGLDHELAEARRHHVDSPVITLDDHEDDKVTDGKPEEPEEPETKPVIPKFR